MNHYAGATGRELSYREAPSDATDQRGGATGLGPGEITVQVFAGRRCSPSRPSRRSRPSRMVQGWGGQPGMYRSTGRNFPQPLWTSGLSIYGPPLMAQAPTAMTSLGAGMAA